MDVFLPLLAVLAISLFFVARFRLNAAAAPFLAISLITVWLCLWGMLGLLILGFWLAWIFAAFCLVWVFAIKKMPPGELASLFFTPGMVFFIAACVAFFVALKLKNPYFNAWDEFSFWGAAAKSVWSTGELYTLNETLIHNSYPPALPLWCMFLQFFGRNFLEWKAYLAYDIMMLSATAMLLSNLRWKNVPAVCALFLFGVGGVYLFFPTFSGLVPYCSSYADIPVGVVFGGCVLSYFSAGGNKVMKWLVPLLGIAMLAFIKDIGMAVGLVAAMVIAADMVLSRSYPFENGLGARKGWRLLFPLSLFAAAVLVYAVWAVHFSAVTDMLRTPEPYIYSAFEVLTGKDPYFVEMVRRMIAALFTEKLVSFGNVFIMVVVFTLVPILAGILTFDKKRLIRLTVFSLLMAAGFFVYYYFHAYLYTTVFTSERIYDMHSYGRYMSSYAIGWMLGVVGICFSALAQPKLKRAKWVPAVVFTVFLLCANTLFLQVPASRYVFTSASVSLDMPGARQEARRMLDRFSNGFSQQDRFYFVYQDAYGLEWYMFAYESIPSTTLYTLGTGDFISYDTPENEIGYYQTPVSREDFRRYLQEQQADFVFVQHINSYFFEEMGPLFEDGLIGRVDGTIFLYLVVDNGGDDFLLVPVGNDIQLAAAREKYGLD